MERKRKPHRPSRISWIELAIASTNLAPANQLFIFFRKTGFIPSLPIWANGPSIDLLGTLARTPLSLSLTPNYGQKTSETGHLPLWALSHPCRPPPPSSLTWNLPVMPLMALPASILATYSPSPIHTRTLFTTSISHVLPQHKRSSHTGLLLTIQTLWTHSYTPQPTPPPASHLSSRENCWL